MPPWSFKRNRTRWCFLRWQHSPGVSATNINEHRERMFKSVPIFDVKRRTSIKEKKEGRKRVKGGTDQGHGLGNNIFTSTAVFGAPRLPCTHWDSALACSTGITTLKGVQTLRTNHCFLVLTLPPPLIAGRHFCPHLSWAELLLCHHLMLLLYRHSLS